MQHFYAFNYDYNHYNGYLPNSVNIGDYIQSLAAMGFYPHTDGYIDRDSCQTEPISENTKIIANGWYFLDDDHHLFNEKFNPLFVAFHINNIHQSQRHRKVLSYLKEKSMISPIGCRDYSTLSYLRDNHINSYFSSCLTTTLDRNSFTSDTLRSGIIECDLPFNTSTNIFPLNRFLATKIIKYKLEKILKNTTYHNLDTSEITSTTHKIPLTTTHLQRFSYAKNLLRTYASAKLVITSRIHCALPCLALGTPVILIAEYDKLRYQGLSDLLNHIFIDKFEIKEISIATDNSGNIINPETYKPFAEQLKLTCKNFISNN